MKKSRDTTRAVGADYRQFVTGLKSRIVSARLSAARHVNRELVALYWDIGRCIVEKQQALGWGESVVEMVAAELRATFPDMTGFSARNVWDMKRLYEAYSVSDFLSQLVKDASRDRKSQILRQPVAELGHGAKRRQPAAKMGKGANWPQLVAKTDDTDPAPILQQIVAEIP